MSAAQLRRSGTTSAVLVDSEQVRNSRRKGTAARDGVAAPAHMRDDFVSAADYAYASLRQEIVLGRFGQGRRLREIELAQWLGVSRTPLRHALSRLEADGLLTMLPRTGLVVASLDDQAVFELYQTREALEGTASAFAARNANETNIAILEGLASPKVKISNDPATLYQHNRAFHEAVYAAAHNRFLLKSLQALHDALALLGPTTLTAPGRPEQAQREHVQIVSAIVKGDAQAAEAAMREHIRNGFPLRRAMRAKQAR